MKRRTFVGGLMALTGLGALMKSATPEPPNHITVRLLSYTALVQGDPALVRQFLYRFQTELWPTWQTDSCPAARNFMAQIEPFIAAGKSGVAMAGKQGREAFENTVKSFRADQLTLENPYDRQRLA